jgi:hypothetical protein
MTSFAPSVSTGYGTSVPPGSTSSGYGTINPKPTGGLSGAFGGPVNGELHIGQVDEHMGDASYNPIVHVRRTPYCRLHPNEPATTKMLFVGQVATLWSDPESDNTYITGQHKLPNGFDPDHIQDVNVIAAAVDVPNDRKLFAISIAVQDTQTTLIPAENPDFDASPGSVIYANYIKVGATWTLELSPAANQIYSWPVGRAILPIDRYQQEVSLAL